jgi:Zn-finger nucleic acid-binding protein
MIDVEYSQIELDFCPECEGVWFDSQELELLVGKMGLEDSGLAVDSIADAPEAETTEKPRKCPICNRKMGKAYIGHQPRILIDVCRWGDGLWFDGGEVHQLIKQLAYKPQAGKDSQQQVVNFLGEVFRAE